MNTLAPHAPVEATPLTALPNVTETQSSDALILQEFSLPVLEGLRDVNLTVGPIQYDNEAPGGPQKIDEDPMVRSILENPSHFIANTVAEIHGVHESLSGGLTKPENLHKYRNAVEVHKAVPKTKAEYISMVKLASELAYRLKDMTGRKTDDSQVSPTTRGFLNTREHVAIQKALGYESSVVAKSAEVVPLPVANNIGARAVMNTARVYQKAA